MLHHLLNCNRASTVRERLSPSPKCLQCAPQSTASPIPTPPRHLAEPPPFAQYLSTSPTRLPNQNRCIASAMPPHTRQDQQQRNSLNNWTAVPATRQKRVTASATSALASIHTPGPSPGHTQKKGTPTETL